MKQLDAVAPGQLAHIDGLAFDVDDTLTSDGQLTLAAYQALWSLHEAGIALVPITGGPAGWAHHFARCWPVDAVLAENGALCFYLDAQKRLRRLLTPTGMTEDDRRSRLQKLRASLEAADPKLTFSSDQAYREFDLAVDYSQDVEPWAPERIERIMALCHQQGAQARRSSIHINTWFGEFSKISGFRHWLAQQPPGSRTAVPFERWAYIGDSLNDEPMFEAFEQSCGVANLRAHLPHLKHKPSWISKAAAGDGFAEFAEAILAARPK